MLGGRLCIGIGATLVLSSADLPPFKTVPDRFTTYAYLRRVLEYRNSKMTDRRFPTQSDFAELSSTVNSTISLLNQVVATVNARTNDAAERHHESPNFLHLIVDSARLLKAQVTKLSLLILNKPFTPTAITKIVRDASTGCLPALMTAADLVQEKEDGTILFHTIRANISRLFIQTRDLLEEVPLREADLLAVRNSDRGTLASTGLVWGTCDALIATGDTGLAGIVVQRAQEYRDLLRDAIAELREWKDGSNGTEPDFSNSDEDSTSVGDPFGLPAAIPENDPILRAEVEEVVKKLQHIDLIYPPIIKRRLKRLPVIPSSANQAQYKRLDVLDEFMDTLKSIPEEVDELAGFCYQQNHQEIKLQLAKVCKLAAKAMEGSSLNWQAEADEFTKWSKRWLELMTLP